MSAPRFQTAPTDVQAVLDVLDGVKRRGSGWRACCPAHPDQDPSLDIDVGDSQPFVVKCRSQGCTQEAILAAIRQRQGEAPRPARGTLAVVSNGPRGPEAARYDYHDADGQVVAQKRKYVPGSNGRDKDFEWFRPDGAGGWLRKLEGMRPPLYNLPALREAVALGRTVLVVEGEKDVEAARRLGYVATSGHAGAGYKPRREDLEHLRDGDVVVVCDADTPGWAYGSQWARALHGVAHRVRLVRTLPGLTPGEGGDLSDWCALGGTVRGLDDLVTTAPDYPAPRESAPTVHAPAVPPVPALRTLAQLREDPELTRSVEWVQPDLLEVGTVGILAGKTKAGKSTVASQIAGATTRGVHWLTGDALPQGPRRVLWFCLDEPTRRFVLRAGFLDGNADAFLVFEREQPDRVTAGLVRRLIDEYAPALVVIDTLTALAEQSGIELNDPSQVAPFLRPLVSAVQGTRAAGLFLYHAPHHANRPAGSFQWSAIPDNLLSFYPPGRKDAKSGEEEDDEAPLETRRILKGEGRSFPSFRLRMSYVGGRYVHGLAQPPLRERVLRALNREPASIARLAAALNVRPAAVTDEMHLLQTAGAVHWTGSSSRDKRGRWLLTTAGLRLLEQAGGIHAG